MSKSKFQHWPKRDPIKNCFLLPNEVFQLDLSGGAKLVYAYLLYCEDRKTYQCYPSYKKIGLNVNMSVNTVKKYVEELVDKVSSIRRTPLSSPRMGNPVTALCSTPYAPFKRRWSCTTKMARQS